MRKLTIVGPVPEPVGGVSTYVYRLSFLLPDKIHKVLDIYSGKKMSIPVGLECAKGGPWFNLFWLYIKLPRSSDDIVHFNFSKASSLLFLFFLRKGRSKWLVTLHHGSLAIPNGFLGFVCRLASKKIDVSLAINYNQEVFYRKEFLSNEVLKVDSYIPPVLKKEKGVTEKFSSLRKQYGKVVLANGYIKPYYNFEYIIELAKLHQDSAFLIIVYGDQDSEYFASIEDGLKKSGNIFIHEAVSPDVFLSILSHCDLYVRPNTVDSFGLAVADAVLLGVPVVASDVCDRFDGAVLYQNDSFDDFCKKSSSILDSDGEFSSSIDADYFFEDKKKEYAAIYDRWGLVSDS